MRKARNCVMKEDFDPLFGNNNQDRLVKLEDMFTDSAYYYFDVAEWEGMIEHYLSHLKLDKATKALNFAKRQHPFSSEILLKEAEVHSETGQIKKALQILNQLEKTHPFEAEIDVQKGNIFSRNGEHLKAIECFKRVLTKGNKEEKTDAYSFIASEFTLLKRPHLSIYWFKKQLKDIPENLEGLYDLALIYEAEEMLDDGIAFFEKYLEDKPYSHHAWFNLGNLYSINNQLNEALGAYDFSVIAFEEFSSGWYNKGSILARLGLYTDAIEAFEQTLELEGPSSSTYCNIGECLEELEKPSEAIDYYQKAILHDTFNMDAYVGAASCWVDLNDLEKAIDYCQIGFEVEKDHANLQHVYGEICQGLGYFKEARKAFKKVIKLDKENWEVFLDYSAMLWEIGQLEEAVSVIDSGISLHGNISELNYRSGVYHYLSGDNIKAFNLWNNAYIENPSQLEQIFDFCDALKNDPQVVDFFEQF